MNVLLLRANPRKVGYTERLANLFRQGLDESGAKVTDVDLTTLSIQTCLGCFHCWLATPGQCVLSDDMTRQLELVLEADVIVCVTPLYYFSMNSTLKAWFERTFPLAQPGIEVSRRGLSRNRTRYPERWQGKKLISMVVGALRDPEAYRPVNETLALIADTLDLELGGQLTRPESCLLDYPLSKPKTLKLIENAFIQAGREAGSTGRLSEETVTNAALPLSASLEHFRNYSNIFWMRTAELGERGLEPGAVPREVAGDVRILLQEMVRCLDPKATARVKAVLQFEFPDLPLTTHLRIDQGQCELIPGVAEAPDLVIRCASSVWAGVFMRTTAVRDALRDRTLVLEGDKSLFTRLDRFFPPPNG